MPDLRRFEKILIAHEARAEGLDVRAKSLNREVEQFLRNDGAFNDEELAEALIEEFDALRLEAVKLTRALRYQTRRYLHGR